MNKEILIIGAGNIGKGVVGMIYARAGYQLHFYDLAYDRLAEMKSQGYYTVWESGDGESTSTEIRNFDLVQNDENGLVAALIHHTVAACSVYEGAFKSIGEHIAQAVEGRIRQNIYKPLNILLCVNSLNAPEIFASYIKAALRGNEQGEYFRQYIGICQVMVLSAALPTAGISEDKFQVTVTKDPHLEIDGVAYKGEKPVVAAVTYVENAEARIYRKVYVGNMRHCMAAYMGSFKGYQYIDESQHDPEIRFSIQNAFKEAHSAINRKYQLDPLEDIQWVKYMDEKLDAHVKDDISRVTANSEKKLGFNERFVGPAKLCMEGGILPYSLAKGIAYGLAYLVENDEKYKDYLKNFSLDDLIKTVCGINESDWVLFSLIKEQCKEIAYRKK